MQKARIFALSAVVAAGLSVMSCSPDEEAATADADTAPAPSGDAPASTGPAETATPAGQELPSWKVPNVPPSGEAYYAPDSLHLIAQTKDPAAIPAANGKEGNLTYTFTDQGEDIKKINDRGQDACSYFFPDQQRVVWTSTRDNMDMPVGDWSNPEEYPTGAELYISDLDGGNVQRLTHNKYYEAEVSISPDGKWIVFGRQIDGKDDLWRMRSDGTGEEQITFTDDWQEGAPFYLPDSETIMFRAPKRSEHGKFFPTPMTVFTMKHDGTERTAHTFDHDMNWAPYPAPDGRHYVFVRVVDGKNWEIFLGDLEGGDPVRLTYYDGWDGLPSVSPDGTKMAWTRSEADGTAYTHIMDVSSLNIGPVQ